MTIRKKKTLKYMSNQTHEKYKKIHKQNKMKTESD